MDPARHDALQQSPNSPCWSHQGTVEVMVRTLSHVFFVDPNPVRRVLIQTGIHRKLNFVSVRTIKVCVFITAGPIIKLCAGGEGDSEGHVL